VTPFTLHMDPRIHA